MTMEIRQPIDIENAVRLALKDYVAAYCRPLPATYTLPNILVTATGGTQETDWHGRDQADTFTVNLTCRGETEASALDCLRKAIGILKESQGGTLARVTVNSQYSWGNDTVRPDLAMCGATLIIVARPEIVTVSTIES